MTAHLQSIPVLPITLVKAHHRETFYWHFSSFTKPLEAFNPQFQIALVVLDLRWSGDHTGQPYFMIVVVVVCDISRRVDVWQRIMVAGSTECNDRYRK